VTTDCNKFGFCERKKDPRDLEIEALKSSLYEAQSALTGLMESHMAVFRRNEKALVSIWEKASRDLELKKRSTNDSPQEVILQTLSEGSEP
jgi:hypothetical protein